MGKGGGAYCTIDGRYFLFRALVRKHFCFSFLGKSIYSESLHDVHVPIRRWKFSTDAVPRTRMPVLMWVIWTVCLKFIEWLLHVLQKDSRQLDEVIYDKWWILRSEMWSAVADLTENGLKKDIEDGELGAQLEADIGLCIQLMHDSGDDGDRCRLPWTFDDR